MKVLVLSFLFLMLVDFFSRAMVMGFSCYIPSVGGVHGGTVDRSSVGGVDQPHNVEKSPLGIILPLSS